MIKTGGLLDYTEPVVGSGHSRLVGSTVKQKIYDSLYEGGVPINSGSQIPLVG